MKTFSHKLNLEELHQICAEKGWVLNTWKHDNEGSDFVTFGWKHKNKVIPVIYSVFNGTFIVEQKGRYYSERSADGCTPWFDDLLNLLYTPLVPA